MSSGTMNTAQIILYLARQLQAGKLPIAGNGDARQVSGRGVEAAGVGHAYTDTIKKRKRANLENASVLYQAMLVQVPGMSAAKALAVAQAFPSMRSLLDAEEHAVADVKCDSANKRRLGAVVARRLLASVRGEEPGEGEAGSVPVDI